MSKTSFFSGVGFGLSTMYLLDPERGRRRRARVRDRMKRMWRRSGAAVGKTSRDLKNRTQGVRAVTESLFRRDETGDEVLEARVRSRLGRLVSHPGAISVEVRPGGAVILSGPVLEKEVRELMAGVAAVPGVASVENHLQPHTRAAGVPGLQGGPEHSPQHRFELMQTNWSPAARALVGAAGSTLAFWGLTRRGVSGATLGVLGAAALLRSISNKEMKQMTGAGSVRRKLEVRSIVNINCPVERVYEFWANYENFPLFMSHLKEVRDRGRGRSHWVAVGPAGISVEWDAEVTETAPERIAGMAQRQGLHGRERRHRTVHPDGWRRLAAGRTHLIQPPGRRHGTRVWPEFSAPIPSAP